MRLRHQQAERRFQTAKQNFDEVELKISELGAAISRVQSGESGFSAEALDHQAAHLDWLLAKIEMARADRVQLKQDFDAARTSLAKAMLALEQLSESR